MSILRHKCIYTLEFKAEAFYSCHDRANQSRRPKTSYIGRFPLLSDIVLLPRTTRDKRLPQLLSTRAVYALESEP